MLAALLFAQSVSDDGLTLHEIIQNLPHDGPSVVGYGLIAIFGLAVWFGSRPKRRKGA